MFNLLQMNLISALTVLEPEILNILGFIEGVEPIGLNRIVILASDTGIDLNLSGFEFVKCSAPSALEDRSFIWTSLCI